MVKKIQIDFSLGKSCMPDQMWFTVLGWQTCGNVVWQCWLYKFNYYSINLHYKVMVQYLRGIRLSGLSLPSDVSVFNKVIHLFVCSFLWFVQSAYCLTALVEFFLGINSCTIYWLFKSALSTFSIHSTWCSFYAYLFQLRTEMVMVFTLILLFFGWYFFHA